MVGVCQKSKRMQIVSSYINGAIDKEFFQDILHEMEHLYQYSRGFEKNESFYDKAIKLASSTNRVERAVGFVTYYTFRHEQDAMVHQFYGYLLQNDTLNKSFDELLRQSEYSKALAALEIVKRNKKEAGQYVYKLGINIRQWNYRVHYQYKRFRQKLYNAFLRHAVIDQKKTVSENKCRDINLRNIIVGHLELEKLFERYPRIQYGIESIYEFRQTF